VKPKFQLLFIALVIILILVGESIVLLPQQSTGPSVLIKSYPSTDALVQALSNGEVDVAPVENVAPQTLSLLKNNLNLNIVPIANFGFTYIGLNLRDAPLNNSVFREAMLYGFNRERVLNAALVGYGETLTPGLFSSAYAALGWRNNSLNSYPYDPAKASQLLDSLGFIESSGGVRTDPSTGEQLHTMFIFSKLTDPQAVVAANLFAEDMQAIGLPVISFPTTDFDFNSLVRVTYSFDMYIDTETAGVAPTWLYNLFAGVNDLAPVPLSTNLVGYRNSNFNECADQLMTTSDSNSAKIAAFRCQEQLGSDIPAIPVYSKSLLMVEQKTRFNITPIAGSIADTLAASLANMTDGGLVRIGEVGGLADINPATALGTADSLTLRLLTEPLLTHSSNGATQSGLIDQWQASDNATNLTLTLQQGFEFQDGTLLTSHDLAETLNWLVANMIPSTPLYPILKTVKSITETSDRTIRISLSKPNYFLVYEIGSLFALPANSLPPGNPPLSLLLGAALQSSGPFELARFAQSVEVELRRTMPAGGNTALMLSGVMGEDLLGTRVGGSQIPFTSQPLNYGGKPIENATFTVHVHDGDSVTAIQGAYLALGSYRATLNLNTEIVSAGSHIATTELYGQLPTGIIIQFDQRNLVIYPPRFLGQLIVYLLAIASVAFLLYDRTRAKPKRVARRRGRRARLSRAKRSRRRR
jgi:ABC-type transport system substrate-binding protein